MVTWNLPDYFHGISSSKLVEATLSIGDANPLVRAEAILTVLQATPNVVLTTVDDAISAIEEAKSQGNDVSLLVQRLEWIKLSKILMMD